MFILKRKGWELPESAATPEHVFFNRRKFMAGGVSALAALSGAGASQAAAKTFEDPTADLYPASRNETFTLDRAVTPSEITSTYNNFYEFGSHKKIYEAAQRLPLRPWTVKIDGEVEEEKTIDIDTLIRSMTLEERLYRLRCVEAWSMAVPWTGFALRHLVEMARPLSSAKYVRLETFENKSVAPGQRQFWYPWPYVEGLTMAEATNDLAFLVTGVYGKPLPPQFGAPIRLALPWKYGFKSIKSIVRISFSKRRPKSFWQQVQGSEYGFWANVNPEVPHPRWSQASERVLGTDERVPTQLFNGYADYVADIYKDIEGEQLWR